MSPRLDLRPLQDDDAPALRRIADLPGVVEWWDEADADFPFDHDADTTRLTILVDGAVAGLIQYWEEADPKYRHAGIDVFLDPAHHRRGLGTEAVRRVARVLLQERGHHRVTIDPAAHNAPAIKAYTKVGFRPVGTLRQYERDHGAETFHDGLLMELLAGELLED